MKLRLKGNTIRLRLLEPEVQRLAVGEPIIETLPTPKPFHFEVRPAQTEEVGVHFEGSTLSISVPADWASHWPESPEVGRRAIVAGMDVLIEKDWACTTARPEDNTGTYPNPTKA